MIRKEEKGIEWLEFELFSPYKEIRQGLFLRKGGVSQGPFSSLNLKVGFGDSPLFVEENRKRIQKTLCLNEIAWSLHPHLDQSYIVEKGGEAPPYDALITQKKGLGLMITHADCQAAFFYDPKHSVLAAVHAGWRGQMADIYQKVVQTLTHFYESQPSDILVGISPSLGPHYSEFKSYQREFPKPYWSFQFKPFYFDLWALASYQLEKAGILPEHIEIARMDTYSLEEDFFSYRREKAKGREVEITGVHGSVIALV